MHKNRNRVNFVRDSNNRNIQADSSCTIGFIPVRQAVSAKNNNTDTALTAHDVKRTDTTKIDLPQMGASPWNDTKVRARSRAGGRGNVRYGLTL